MSALLTSTKRFDPSPMDNGEVGFPGRNRPSRSTTTSTIRTRCSKTKTLKTRVRSGLRYIVCRPESPFSPFICWRADPRPGCFGGCASSKVQTLPNWGNLAPESGAARPILNPGNGMPFGWLLGRTVVHRLQTSTHQADHARCSCAHKPAGFLLEPRRSSAASTKPLRARSELLDSVADVLSLLHLKFPGLDPTSPSKAKSRAVRSWQL